jgi:hypothetical protein
MTHQADFPSATKLIFQLAANFIVAIATNPVI